MLAPLAAAVSPITLSSHRDFVHPSLQECGTSGGLGRLLASGEGRPFLIASNTLTTAAAAAAGVAIVVSARRRTSLERRRCASIVLHAGAKLQNAQGALLAASLATLPAMKDKQLMTLRRQIDSLIASRSATTSTSGTEAVSPTVEAELRTLGEWCALVINLERRPDRMETTEKLLATTNPRLLRRLERIDAVDGQKLGFDDDAVRQIIDPHTLDRAKRAKQLGIYSVVHDTNNILVEFDDHMTEGAIACAMSHHKALQRVATHPTAEWGLILEDDNSVVVPDVDRAIARILKQLPEDWDAVYLGYHHDLGKPHPLGLRVEKAAAPVRGNRIATPEALEEADVAEVAVSEVHGHCWGLFAWMVKKEAAQQLVDNLFPINTQVDGAISGWLCKHRGRGRVFQVPPEKLLFYSSCSEEGQDSDIQTMALEQKVVEEYGSWQDYKNLSKKPTSSYDEDMYAFMGEYAADDDYAQP